MLEIGNTVTVRFLGKLFSGKIVDIGGNHEINYQVLIDNEQRTCLWFGADEIE